MQLYALNLVSIIIIIDKIDRKDFRDYGWSQKGAKMLVKTFRYVILKICIVIMVIKQTIGSVLYKRIKYSK